MATMQLAREKLNMEMILRKSFRDSCKDYVRNCSLPGAKQMCDPGISWFQRLIWALVFCTAFATALYFLNYIWSDTLTRPLIVTLESTEYPNKNIDFPAVAICNVNRISKKALIRFAEEEYKDIAEKETPEEVQQMLLNFGRLIDFSYNDTLRRNPTYTKIVNKYRKESDRIVPIMRSLAPSCNDMLLLCTWAGKIVDCASIFSLRRTANRGYCCTFNYLLSYNSAKSPLTMDEEVNRQVTPGFLHGLTVVLDPMLDDYAYPLGNIQGFDVLLFDSKHFADPTAGRVIHRILESNTALFLEIKSTKQIATNEIRKYNLKTRGCYFQNEMQEDFHNMYSYSTCIVACRVITIRSLCKCVPFFYATNKNFLAAHVCTLEDLRCLNKYKEKLYYLYPYGAEVTEGLEMELEDSLTCPECLPDCELTQHSAKSFSTPILPEQIEKTLRTTFFDNINITGKAALSVFHPTSDAKLVRLDVVSYWYEILSNFGGFCGVIAGFTSFSVVEIIYFFTIRYVYHVCKNYKKYH